MKNLSPNKTKPFLSFRQSRLHWVILYSSLCVSGAMAQNTVASQPAADKSTSGHHHVVSDNTPDEDKNRPSMIGQTAPTDEKSIVVVGRSYADGVTRRGIGGGLMIKEDAPKSKSTITRDYIEKQTPGLNPMQLIALLPGVNTADSDPMGLTGGHTSVRGMNEASMGYTLEGFPLNDIGSYAVYPQEIVDSENLSTIQVAQGSADLDSPTISAAGGVVNMYMIDPTKKMGGRANFTYGSYNTFRGFARFDTGEIGNSGTRAYFSFSDTHEDLWRGPGTEKKLHGEMKVVKEWGKDNRASLVVVGNNLDNYNTPSVNMASWKQYGTGAMGGPVSGTANTVYSSIYTGNTKANTTYYKLHPNPFTNLYVSAPTRIGLGHNMVLTETPYFWYGNGNGGGAYWQDMNKMSYGSQTMSGTVNGQNYGQTLLYEPSITKTYRPGAVTKWTWTSGINRLMVGYWFEYSTQRQTAPYTLLNDDGSPKDKWGGGASVVLANGKTAEYRDTMTRTMVNTPFIGDSISLLNNRLTIDAGVKYSIIKRDGRNYLPDTSTGEKINQTYRAVLPTGSVRFKINNEHQLFFSVATNFRAPMNTSLYDSGAYSASSGGYSNKAATGLKPETTISEEFGWRYQGKLINTSLTYFHYDFHNRLFSQTVIDPNNPTSYYSTNINGGNQTSNGVDFEIGTRAIYNIRPYVSGEYIDARTKSNLFAAASGVSALLPTKGKFAPQTPRYQVGFGLDYDNGHIFGNFSLKYVGSQYSTFMNDEEVPSYVRMDVGGGYRFKSWGGLKSPTIKFNISNIANKHYLNYASGITTNANYVKSVDGQTIKGSSPTYGIASPFSAMFSISTGF